MLTALRCIRLCALLLFAGQVQGAEPEHALTQFAHTAWRVQEGFLSAVPLAIAQTLDGQLWVGGEGGLVRFDGFQFVPWRPPQGTQLRSERILSLLGASDGSLWIGTNSGLARWKEGRLTVYTQVGSFWALLEDRRGTVWAGHTRDLNKLPPLCNFSADKFNCFSVSNQTGLLYVSSLAEDRQGNLWIGGDRVVCRWQAGRTDCDPVPARTAKDAEFPINSIKSDTRGDLWVDAGSTGIWRLSAGRWNHFDKFPKLPLQSSAARDQSGNDLWMSGVGRGLIRSVDGKTDRFTRSDGLSGDTVSTVFVDRDGNIWVATSGGLDRFRDMKIATLTPREGLTVEETTSIAASRDGSVWISAENKLVHLQSGKIEAYDARTTFGAESLGAVLEDSRGRLWFGAGDHLVRRENRGFRQPALLLNPKVRRPVRVRALAEDTDGTIWAATTDPDAILVHVRDNRVVESFTQGQVGGTQVTAMVADPRGGIWLGQSDRRLTLYRNGQFEERGDSFPDRTRALLVDVRGVWAATNRGLALYHDGTVAVLDGANGLPCDDLFAAVKDASDALWVKSQCGLVQISASELDAWANDHARRVKARLLDTLDGARAGFPEFSPSQARSVDGRLWFAGRYAGVQVVDPARLADEPVAPSAAITDVVADRKTYERDSILRLPPLTRDMTIGYTAYSPAAPERVRFRYRLEGADGVWLDAGPRREAFFAKLGPGRYRFEVLASNNDGVWSNRPGSLEFEIAAAYYQTWWFRLLIGAVVVGALWAAYRWRTRNLAREFNKTLEARVEERLRIARELHDTLLQSFHGLLLRFQTIYELLPARPSEAKQNLGSAIDMAAQAITEGRDAVQGLRAPTLDSNDLEAAIRAAGEEFAAEEHGDDAAALSVVIKGTPRGVCPILRDEIYRIASEALRNAFHHAQAKQIEVELRYDERQLRLRVRDDGKGIDPKFLGKEGRARHYGLHGMRERAKLMGGKLTVWSALESGTEIELTIPASRAYATADSTRRSWFAEKLSTKGTQTEP